jgi:protoporphyrinogen oxidase
LVKKAIIIGAGISGLCIGAILVKHGINVEIYEKMSKVGGRTASIFFRNHILDNGFHIMPFYKKSSLYKVLNFLDIHHLLKLSKVSEISFYHENKFYKYPKGLLDFLSLSLLPFKNRLEVLKLIVPMAFASIKQSEKRDNIPLSSLTNKLGNKKSNSFFDAICMLAFADTQEHVSVGEFIRTIIKANPFRGGTSEFGYPSDGGYDTISKLLAHYITSFAGSKIILNETVKKIIVKDGKAEGIEKSSDSLSSSSSIIKGDCVIVSYPAYLAIHDFFDENILNKNFINNVNRLNKSTSVIETHYATSKNIEKKRQIVFPTSSSSTAKGIFFISNITESVSPKGEYLVLVGTPVTREEASSSQRIMTVKEKMKKDIYEIYPNFDKFLIWERTMAWQLVESVSKEPGLVWKQKMPHTIDDIKGLFFVGDSTISYGIGTDAAAHSALLCYPKVFSFLKEV